MFIWLLFAAAGVVPIVGVVLAFRAPRARQLDDHRVCAKCRYDLHGSPPDTTACPECGASLCRRRATYTGNRAIHGRMLAFGLLALLLGLSGAAFVGVSAKRGYNWNQHTPMPLLIHDAFESQDPWRSRSSAYAFYDRHQAGTLSHQDYTRIVEGLLDYQADPAKPWVFFWGDLMEILRLAGHVTDDQWRRFITQMYTWELVGEITNERRERRWTYDFRLVGSPRSATPRWSHDSFSGWGPDNGDIVFIIEGESNEGEPIRVEIPRVNFDEDHPAVADVGGRDPRWLAYLRIPREQLPPGRYTCAVSLEWYHYDTRHAIPNEFGSVPHGTPWGTVYLTHPITYSATFEVVEP